jgi:hypothetical protein
VRITFPRRAKSRPPAACILGSALQALAVALGVEVGPLLEGVTFPTQEKPGRAARPRKALADKHSEKKQSKKKGR